MFAKIHPKVSRMKMYSDRRCASSPFSYSRHLQLFFLGIFLALVNTYQQFRYVVVLTLDDKNDENGIRHTTFDEISLYNDQESPLVQGAGENRYLLYYSHSGFTNQVISMETAAYLALATNRTLVLPPVLPHGTSEDDLVFSAFESRTAGSKCRPYDFYHKYIKTVQDDVQKASDPEILFPSLMELFDFNELTQKTGLNVVDMREFAKDSKNTNFTHWCTGAPNEIEKKMVPGCGKSEKLSFTDLVPQFQHTCGLDQRVAVIGSAFVIPAPEGVKKGLLGFKDMLTPSRNFLSLLNQIHSRLPADYAGVHIRFKDNLVVDTCDDPDVKEAYELVFRDLVKQKAAYKGHVLIGNCNRAALRCFHYHAQGRYTASTINDIIDNDEALQRMVDEIKLEKSTIYLLLDQILIALAEKVALRNVATTAGTFRSRIMLWHNRRDTILEKMHMV